MNPTTTRAAISKLKLGVLLAMAGAGVGGVILKRLPEFTEAFWPAVGYVGVGLVVVVLVLKIVASDSR